MCWGQTHCNPPSLSRDCSSSAPISDPCLLDITLLSPPPFFIHSSMPIVLLCCCTVPVAECAHVAWVYGHMLMLQKWEKHWQVPGANVLSCWGSRRCRSAVHNNQQEIICKQQELEELFQLGHNQGNWRTSPQVSVKHDLQAGMKLFALDAFIHGADVCLSQTRFQTATSISTDPAAEPARATEMAAAADPAEAQLQKAAFKKLYSEEYYDR